MMRQHLLLPFLFLLLGMACQKKELPDIHAIENGLLLDQQPEGSPVQTFSLAERMEHYQVPGLSIAVVEKGKLKWAKGYGIAHTGTGQAVDTETLFQAGSISKPVAALAVLKLVQEGLLDLDVDVNQYLKEWQVPENAFTAKEKVTLRGLLSHTAGVNVHGFPGYKQTDPFPSLVEVLNGSGNTPPIEVDKLPGSGWRYSGGGYTIFEKVVEEVTGRAFERYMEEEILLPLGMRNSSYEQPIGGRWQKNSSAAYDRQGEILEGFWHNYPEKAAAGLWTTPTELAKYCIAIQEIRGGKEDGLLRPELVEQMLTEQDGSWGLGPALEQREGRLLFKHGGKNAGFTNQLIAFADEGNAVIVMTNADRGNGLIRELLHAVSAYYGWGISSPKLVAPESAD
ncbi:serine hydrolase domain-containing protein [Nitritalea halalkaliphila]|nr:serine hydrolase domain-containing protein [Nitritalea halalkaliphila]